MYPRIRIIIISDCRNYHLRYFLTVFVFEIPKVFTLKVRHSCMIQINSVRIVDIDVSVWGQITLTIILKILQASNPILFYYQ